MATAARVAATMMRAGRMTTSLCSDGPVGLGPQHDLAWSRGCDGRATRQARTGLDPVAIIDRNEHASQAPKRSVQAASTVKPPQRRTTRTFHQDDTSTLFDHQLSSLQATCTSAVSESVSGAICLHHHPRTAITDEA